MVDDASLEVDSSTFSVVDELVEAKINSSLERADGSTVVASEEVEIIAAEASSDEDVVDDEVDETGVEVSLLKTGVVVSGTDSDD